MGTNRESDFRLSQVGRPKLLTIGALGLTVVIAVIVAFFIVNGSNSDESDRPNRLEDVDVKVVDSGFSVYKNDGKYWEQSFGYLVENRSNQVAIAEVEYWYVDNNGDKVGEVERSRPFYVFPNQKVGGGATGWWGKVDKEESVIHDVKYKVYAVGAGKPGKYEAGEVAAKVASREKNSKVHEYESLDRLKITMDSDFEDTVKVESMGILYRDKGGKIVGGWGPFQHLPYRDSGEYPEQGREVSSFDVHPGKQGVEIDALTPSHIDDEGTEIYVSPFVTRDSDDPRWICVKCTLKKLGLL